MNKFVQIRNMPEAKHRKLKARAAARGLTITDYVKALIEKDLDKPTWAEIAREIEKTPPMHLAQSSAAIIRAIRDEK